MQENKKSFENIKKQTGASLIMSLIGLTIVRLTDKI